MPITPTSALSEQSQGMGLVQQIMEVPEPVWKKISNALKVETRQEAVQLVQIDEQAAAVVSEIIRTSATRKSALTETKPMPRSALSYSAPTSSVAERLYGGGGKARLRIG